MTSATCHFLHAFRWACVSVSQCSQHCCCCDSRAHSTQAYKSVFRGLENSIYCQFSLSLAHFGPSPLSCSFSVASWNGKLVLNSSTTRSSRLRNRPLSMPAARRAPRPTDRLFFSSNDYPSLNWKGDPPAIKQIYRKKTSESLYAASFRPSCVSESHCYF